tara:strand:- start:35152 stop:35571 length:420 start_codon:yes stop_codon:yes gene_type:complete
MHRIFTLMACVVCVFFLSVGVSDASEKSETSGSTEYVKLQPLLLPIIDDDGVQQVVSMVVAIEVNGVSDADKIKAMSPRLTDAYIQDMYGILNKHAALKGGIIQVHMIKQRLNEVTDKVVGDADIHTEVLIQVVQQRPI